MPKCRLCNQEFYEQTYTDPVEPCGCSYMVSDSLLEFGGVRAVLTMLGYRIVYGLWGVANWLCDKIEKQKFNND